MESIVGIFENRADAEAAVERLVALGLRRHDVNLLTPANANEAESAVRTDDTEQPGVGTALGSVVGAAAGASVGAAAVALVPGIGPVVAAGWAAMALLGLAGAVGGGVAGHKIEDALSSGIPKEELYVYEDALRKGHSVVVAFAADDELAGKARAIMREAGAEDLDTARERWWLGIRAEDEEYREPGYREGAEAAFHPDVRGKSYDDAASYLHERHADVYRGEAFRRGYERGRAHYQEHAEKHRE